MKFKIGWRSTVGVVAGLALWSVGCSDPSESGASASSGDTAASVEEATLPSDTESGSALASDLAPEVAAAREANRMALTKDALDQLAASADFLAEVPSYRFEADLSFDVLQNNGQMLEFGDTRTATVRQPDRLRVDVNRRGGERVAIYFDGKHLSVDLHDHEAYVRVEKPGTTDAVLDYMSTELAMPTPLQQFLSSNFAADSLDRIETGYFVDVEQLDDRWCEHFAYRTPDVDFELWIEEGDRPLPCRVVISYKREPGDPQFIAQFRHWDLSAKTPDSLFVFTPSETAEHLAVQAVAQSIRESKEIQ
jgi:hypothetical protein